MGVEQAMVVHGSGLDEVALHGETRAMRLSGGRDRRAGDHAGGSRPRPAPLKVVTGGDVEENAARLKALLPGRGAAAEEDT